MAFIVSSLLVLSYENFREFLDKMCRCDGMVDVADSKSAGGDSVWVRVPPPAPRRSKLYIACSDLFYKSERAHAAAPPFQIEPAALGFDLGFFFLLPYRFRVAAGTMSE